MRKWSHQKMSYDTPYYLKENQVIKMKLVYYKEQNK